MTHSNGKDRNDGMLEIPETLLRDILEHIVCDSMANYALQKNAQAVLANVAKYAFKDRRVNSESWDV